MDGMRAVYDAILNLYNENIELLEHIDKNLATRVDKLSQQIDKGLYKPRYELELIDGNFNIYDTKEDKFLYDISLDRYNYDALNNIKDNSLNRAAFLFLSDTAFNISSPKAKRIEDGISLKNTSLLYEMIFKYRKKLNYFKLNQKQKLDYYPSFIFFGTLLGQHIIKIANFTKSKQYLIVEESLEIFRLSLFTTEYKQLLQYAKGIKFCIEEDELNTIEKYSNFLDDSILYNYCFKFFSTSYHSIKLIEYFSTAIYKKSPVSYDFIRMLDYCSTSINRLKKYPHIIPKKENKISNKPILILGPGPSLRKNIEFIKKNRDNFILLCFSATLNLLCEFDIKPDIITLVDASDILLTHFKDECKDLYQDSIKIFATNVYGKIIDKATQNNLYLMETIFKLTSDGLYESPAMTVGDGSLFLLLALGFKEIYLLGTDLAIDEQTGSGYDKTHKQSSKKISQIRLNKNIKEISLNPKINTDFLEIRGNFRPKVYTNNFFASIISSYIKIIEELKNDREFNIYNLNDGAYIPGTIPLKLDEIRLNKFANKQESLKEIMQDLSSIGFSKKDFKNFKKEVLFLKSLLFQVNIFKNSTIETYKDFESFNYTLIDKNEKHTSFSQLTRALTYNFYSLLSNYILYYFNSPNSDKKLLNEVKNMWCDDFINILNQLIKVLEIG